MQSNTCNSPVWEWPAHHHIIISIIVTWDDIIIYLKYRQKHQRRLILSWASRTCWWRSWYLGRPGSSVKSRWRERAGRKGLGGCPGLCGSPGWDRGGANKSYFFFNFSHVGYRLRGSDRSGAKKSMSMSMLDTNLHIPDVVNVQGFLKADHQTLKRKQ